MILRFPIAWIASLVATAGLCAAPVIPADDRFPLQTVDLSAEVSRQVVVASGTTTTYQGHPTTVLLADGRTMFCVWTYGHGGRCGPIKRSDDGGRTWSELIEVPPSWSSTRNCPTIYRLSGPEGTERLVVYAGHGPDADASMHIAHSEDGGKTWSDMRNLHLSGLAMPFCAVQPIERGRRLLGITNIRRPGERVEQKSNVIAQSYSDDGGLTWAPWRVVLDLPGLKPCEPELIRSPDGRQLLCLMRENVRRISLFMTSDDEGKTWSAARPLPAGLHGDRHIAKYLPDGRLVVCFRDSGASSPTQHHFVAWVGRYEDLLSGEAAMGYRVKLLHSHRGWDCGYPGVEVLPDGTVVATTYIKYRPGAEKHSVVSTRFHPRETDAQIASGHPVSESASKSSHVFTQT